MSLKSLYQSLKNTFTGEKQDALPLPPIKPGKMPLSMLGKAIRWKKERRGKTRGYKPRPIPYLGSYRKLRMHQIRMSQLHGVEIAKARREAQKNGTMLDFKIRNFPRAQRT